MIDIDEQTRSEWLSYLAHCEMTEAFDQLLRLEDRDFHAILWSIFPQAAEDQGTLLQIWKVLISDSSLARRACSVTVAFQLAPEKLPADHELDRVFVDLILASARGHDVDERRCREILEDLLLLLPHVEHDLSPQTELRLVEALQQGASPWIVSNCATLVLGSFARRAKSAISQVRSLMMHGNADLRDEASEVWRELQSALHDDVT